MRAEQLPGGAGSVATLRGGGGGAGGAGQRAIGGERRGDAGGPAESEGGVRESDGEAEGIGCASRVAFCTAAPGHVVRTKHFLGNNWTGNRKALGCKETVGDPSSPRK